MEEWREDPPPLEECNTAIQQYSNAAIKQYREAVFEQTPSTVLTCVTICHDMTIILTDCRGRTAFTLSKETRGVRTPSIDTM